MLLENSSKTPNAFFFSLKKLSFSGHFHRALFCGEYSSHLYSGSLQLLHRYLWSFCCISDECPLQYAWPFWWEAMPCQICFHAMFVCAILQ